MSSLVEQMLDQAAHLLWQVKAVGSASQPSPSAFGRLAADEALIFHFAIFHFAAFHFIGCISSIPIKAERLRHMPNGFGLSQPF